MILMTGSFSFGLLIGLIFGALLMGIGFWWMIRREKEGKLVFPSFLKRAGPLAVLLIFGTLLVELGSAKVILAQTSTPVPLVIPLNDIFVQANNWMQTLSPIESLSIGILVALAVFGFLYKAIKSAFG